MAGRYKNREEIGNFNCLAVKKQGRNKNKEKAGKKYGTSTKIFTLGKKCMKINYININKKVTVTLT